MTRSKNRRDKTEMTGTKMRKQRKVTTKWKKSIPLRIIPISSATSAKFTLALFQLKNSIAASG